jgi:hypothetical protein
LRPVVDLCVGERGRGIFLQDVLNGHSVSFAQGSAGAMRIFYTRRGKK